MLALYKLTVVIDKRNLVIAHQPRDPPISPGLLSPKGDIASVFICCVGESYILGSHQYVDPYCSRDV